MTIAAARQKKPNLPRVDKVDELNDITMDIMNHEEPKTKTSLGPC